MFIQFLTDIQKVYFNYLLEFISCTYELIFLLTICFIFIILNR